MLLLRSHLLTAPLIVLATIVFGTAALVVSCFEHTGRLQIRLARQWSRVLLMVSSVTVHLEGIDKITPGASYVFASNHLSYMDTPVALANIPVEFRFLAKKGLFKIPFLGYHLARAGHIPVPREDPRAAVKTLTAAAEAIRERGISLLIFPEGGRSKDGLLHDFKEGAAYIAIKAGVPIVPLALIGTKEVLPFGAGTVLPGNVSMRVGGPIPTAGLTLRDRGKLTAEVRDQIASLLNPISVSTHA